MSANQTPNWTLGPYIQQTLLLLVAPALFAASIYMVLGRIILLTDGEPHSFIRKKWLTKIFVAGDVISFLTQAGGTHSFLIVNEQSQNTDIAPGGGIMATGNGKNYKTGETVVEIGLAMQVVVFGFFVATAAIFHVRMNKVPTSKALTGGIPWKKQMWTLYIASILILIRSVFRLIEYAGGNDGFLLSHEVFLYVFDGLLMLSVMMVFAWIHPSEIYAMLKGGRRAKAVRRGVHVYNLEFRELQSPHGATISVV